ncbi:MAG TPA: hypothetical protein DCW29_08510 [Janthinobacterium sp.]|nr:hypothetical protein [Janthinobacterium sp.]
MKNFFRIASGTVAVVLFASSSAAMADTALYVSSDYANAVHPEQNAWCSTCGDGQIIGDRFTLSLASTVKSTDFAIQSDYGSNWNIHIGIYSAGLQQIAVNTFAPGSYALSPLDNNVSMVHVNLPSLSLGAGTYYMSWYDDYAMGVPGYTAGGSSSEFNFKAGLPIGGYGAAFRVGGSVSAVPEPESYAMLLAGLGLLGCLARRTARSRV